LGWLIDQGFSLSGLPLVVGGHAGAIETGCRRVCQSLGVTRAAAPGLVQAPADIRQ
jgi:hypothetical protein